MYHQYAFLKITLIKRKDLSTPEITHTFDNIAGNKTQAYLEHTLDLDQIGSSISGKWMITIT